MKNEVDDYQKLLGMKMKINWGVDFNTNNYERILSLDSCIAGHFVQTLIDDTYELGVFEFIDDWFYDNISELTACDDEFIKDRNNVYLTDYVEYTFINR